MTDEGITENGGGLYLLMLMMHIHTKIRNQHGVFGCALVMVMETKLDHCLVDARKESHEHTILYSIIVQQHILHTKRKPFVIKIPFVGAFSLTFFPPSIPPTTPPYQHQRLQHPR